MAWQKKYFAPEEKSADHKKAAGRAVWYLSQRDHGSEELYQKLCRFFTQQAAAAAMAQMAQDGYLDDARFAKNKAHTLLAARKSRREIARQLSLKGLDKQLITQTLEEIYQPVSDCSCCYNYQTGALEEQTPTNPELENAIVLIERRYARKLAAGRKDLVVAALTRRGFSYGTIRDALVQVECGCVG